MSKPVIFTWSGEINPTTDPKKRIMVKEWEVRDDLPEDYATFLVEVKGIARWVPAIVVEVLATIEEPAPVEPAPVEPVSEPKPVPEPTPPRRRR